jgi:hypothetical protein
MARSESQREDLLREATALVERAEIRIPDETDSIVFGFRRDGSASFFFGADPVLQFNSAGEFRRGYIGGLLYKAERGRLISLRRERSETEVALIRTALNSDEAQSLLSDARARLIRLQMALTSDSITLIGQLPPDRNVISRAATWLSNISKQIRIAHAPNTR